MIVSVEWSMYVCVHVFILRVPITNTDALAHTYTDKRIREHKGTNSESWETNSNGLYLSILHTYCRAQQRTDLR